MHLRSGELRPKIESRKILKLGEIGLEHNISVPVSVGEFVDKITILRIKTIHIKDSVKQVNIRKELDALERVAAEHGIDLSAQVVIELQQVNQELWDIEDEIRVLERAKDFSQRFIDLARAVYITNDKRFEVKSKVNLHFGSSYFEEKSYEKYN